MMVERYPNLKEEFGSLIPNYDISSLPNGKLAKWSIALLACCLKKKKKEKRNAKKISPDNAPKLQAWACIQVLCGNAM